MAELNKIRFLLFVSLTIFPTHALDVILLRAHGDFKQKSEIKTKIINGQKLYDGTLNQLTYQAEPGTTNVIVYIIGRSRFVEIIRNTDRATRARIAWKLNRWHCELLFLGIENYEGDQYHLIGAFMGDKIQRHPQNQNNLTIETIGENNFDRFYECRGLKFEKYQGNWVERLRSIPRGALRPVGSNNNKIIKFCEYKPYENEVTLPVYVVNDEYIPDDSGSYPGYNFKRRHPNMNVYLAILSGKEYSVATRYGTRSPQMKEVRRILNGMSLNNEVLIILGVFNFEWIEVDIVTQIILKHSEVSFSSDYNVYTCGFGMFNTIYSNEMKDDERLLLQKPNSNVAEIMKVLLGEEVKQRSIDVLYSDNGWRHSTTQIDLINGRYVREGRYNDICFPWPNQKIAFIVHESTGMNDPMDGSMVRRSVENLKRSDINVVVIETTNFGWYDAHIIAEWIDSHKGNVNAEQIAVLGGGIFDTIFQSAKTTYNTLFNFKIKDLKRIRNAYVKSGNEKRIFAAEIDDSANFEVWSYPMDTVNGFYEPGLIPATNMFNTLNETKIFFIITSAPNFHRISAVDNVGLLASWLRQDIIIDFPLSEWSVFLVGLDNFEESDYHLFAELVMMQTRYGRCAHEFVRTFNYGISQAMYQYKDTAPFSREKRPRPLALITTYFESILMTDDA